MELLGKTPQELMNMTLSEIMVAAIDVTKDAEGTDIDFDEMPAYMMWWQTMTPEERLWAE
jgi:hypothetical protein